jgi:hypothetical protein
MDEPLVSVAYPIERLSPIFLLSPEGSTQKKWLTGSKAKVS